MISGAQVDAITDALVAIVEDAGVGARERVDAGLALLDHARSEVDYQAISDALVAECAELVRAQLAK